jgi:hypothetical protein
MIPAACVPQVTLSYFVVPHTLHSERMVAVVVLLVDRQNSRGSINDRHARIKDIPSQPIIPQTLLNAKEIHGEALGDDALPGCKFMENRMVSCTCEAASVLSTCSLMAPSSPITPPPAAFASPRNHRRNRDCDRGEEVIVHPLTR